MTPDLARDHADWLYEMELSPPKEENEIQAIDSVESFGFEWSFQEEPRTDDELEWVTTTGVGVEYSDYSGQRVFDAGCGAGAQSRWILEHGADEIISMDLSRAIDVAGRKLSTEKSWLGIQGDLTNLPFKGPICDFVYCFGVIHHTKSAKRTIENILKVCNPGGLIAMNHYTRKNQLKHRLYYNRFLPALRGRISTLPREKLLFVTGMISAISMTPLIGEKFAKIFGYKNDRMPGFKYTWTGTYDRYGSHRYDRFITNKSWLRTVNQFDIQIEWNDGGRILVSKPG